MVAAAEDSVAVVTVVPAESAIAGKRLTLIEQAKGCHAFMAPFRLFDQREPVTSDRAFRQDRGHRRHRIHRPRHRNAAPSVSLH